MRVIGIKALKDRLSEYVRLASQGETVLISDRDRVVAELSAPRETRAPLVSDAVLADAVRQGLLRPALLPPGAPPMGRPVADLSTILEELSGDRARS